MKQKKRKAAPKKKQVERFIAELEKRGELNPEHRRDFDNMLDDVVPAATKKK